MKVQNSEAQWRAALSPMASALSVCDAHLGHGFPDGPPPSARRHGIPSAALRFRPTAGAAAEPPR